jgi:hypothetical protein
LSASKCSIGSASDDTLRLFGAGVAPAHCLILRGRDQTVVRSWGAATRLNDRPFSDAPLKIGDRLGVGPLELEVVANADSEPVDVESWLCLPSEDDSDPEQKIADEKQRLAEQAASLELLKQSLELQLADVDRMRQEFERQRTTWDGQRQAIEAELTARSEVLDRQAQELEAHVHRLAAQPAASATTRQANEDEALNEEQVFVRLRGHASLKPESVAKPPEQSPPGGPAAIAPAIPAAANDEESIDDYMARLLNRMRGDSGPNQTEAATRPKPRLPKAVMPPTVASPTPAKSLANRKKAEPIAPRPAPVPDQLVARSAAPESVVNLKAMRDLANMTTRGAIDKHAHGRWSQEAVGKGIGGFFTFLCGVWLMFSLSAALGGLVRLMGFAAIVAGIFWIAQAVLLVRNLRLVGRRTNKSVDADIPAGDQEGACAAGEPNPPLQDTAASSATDL